MSISKEELLAERSTIYELIEGHKKRLLKIKDELNALSHISPDDGRCMVEHLIYGAFNCYCDDSNNTLSYVAEQDYINTTYEEALQAMIEMEETERPEVQRAMAGISARKILLGDE